MAEKKFTRSSDEELLKKAKQRVTELEERIKTKSLSDEEKGKIKLAKRPLINAINRLKTLEEIEQVKKALEGLVDFK